MKEFEDDIYCGKLQILGPVLKEWVRLIKKSSRDWGRNDCSWWYNERATLSVLAGAIWRKGGSCFEEYADNKIYKRSNYKGRCDLYFMLNNREFIVEAKQCWPNAGLRAKKLKNTIENALSLAHDDLNHLSKGNGRKLGLVYVVPRMPNSELNQIDTCISNTINIVNDLPVKSFAYTFPIDKRKLCDKGGDGYIYPGVILLIK